MIDEYRKEKRRRDLSDSEDEDDDPFHNRSTAFGATRGRFNATPASSAIGGGSIAGRSRASTIKGTGGPVNISAAGGKGGVSPSPAGEQEFTEDVGGVDEYQSRLKTLWNKRTQLMKTKKKKKKGKKGRSALKNKTAASNYETETAWDDDKTSFMTT